MIGAGVPLAILEGGRIPRRPLFGWFAARLVQFHHHSPAIAENLMKSPPKLHKKGPPKPIWSTATAVRSYKLDEDTATDHRTGRKASARAVLDGALELMGRPAASKRVTEICARPV